MDINWINFGTLKVRGINENYKIKTLVSDIKKYKLDIVGLQETHMKGSGIVKVDKDYSEKQFNRGRNPTLLQHRPCQSKRHTFPSRN